MVLYFVFLKMQLDDTFFMKQAMAEAEKAFHADEVPVGAVVVVGDRIIARAHNLTERLKLHHDDRKTAVSFSMIDEAR